MEMTQLPEPEATLADLMTVLRVVHQGGQWATQQAHEIFDQWGAEPEPYLFGDMVRFRMKRYLDKAGQEVEDDLTWERQELRNNGIFLKYGKYRIRIWKAERGGYLPDMGTASTARLRYCRQLELPLGLGEVPPDGPYNLVVLWSVDHNYNLRDMRLVCPKAGQGSPTAIDEYWNVQIPDPITSLSPPAPVVEEAEDVDDLDHIQPLDLPQTGPESAE
jgi:hypothetical protein